ncbi:MAG: DNA alkylation repair protein, partial [Acidobacteria bacterium]|nr:DNA alkylation repair protein [Acidobacteriota bacterium]
ELWNLEHREFQYFAVGLLDKYVKKVPGDFINIYEWMIINKSWWDTVDAIAANLVGLHFQRFPDLITPRTEKWMKSGAMWLQRTALLFQLRYKDKTDFDLMTRYIIELKDEKEFFIRKAIGWALREYSKTDPDTVFKFVKQNKLAPLSEREALKVIERSK